MVRLRGVGNLDRGGRSSHIPEARRGRTPHFSFPLTTMTQATPTDETGEKRAATVPTGMAREFGAQANGAGLGGARARSLTVTRALGDPNGGAAPNGDTASTASAARALGDPGSVLGPTGLAEGNGAATVAPEEVDPVQREAELKWPDEYPWREGQPGYSIICEFAKAMEASNGVDARLALVSLVPLLTHTV